MFTCLNSFTEKNFAAEAKETIFVKRFVTLYPNVRTLRAITKSRSILIETRDHMMRREKL